MVDVLVASPSFTIKYEAEPLPPPSPVGDVLVASTPFVIQYSPEAPPPAPTGDVLVASQPFTIKYEAAPPPPIPPLPPIPDEKVPDWLLPAAIAGIALIVLAPGEKAKKGKK